MSEGPANRVCGFCDPTWVLQIGKEAPVKPFFFSIGLLIAALAAFVAPAAADELAQASPAPAPSATPSPKPFQASGYIDGGYVSASASGPRGFLNTRIFDNVSGAAQLQTVNLTASYAGTLGGKVELNYGTDADVFHSYPQVLYICPNGVFTCTAPYNMQLDVTQAYASYTGGKFTLIGGKFETLAGAEVIESPSDLNFSRSILFGFAVPFTHTGLRLTYAATPQLSLIVGANRGWDTTYPLSSGQLVKLGAPAATAGDNGSITAEFGAAWNPSSTFSLTAQGYTGTPENWLFSGCNANTGCTRQLIDVVATYHVNPSLTAGVNIDSGQQTGTMSPAFVGGVGTVTWKGVSGYVSQVFNPTITGTLRYEQFVDSQGFRTGFGVGTRWNEGTATAQFAVSPRWTVRGEVRLDTASQPIFLSTKSSTGSQASLTTFGLEAIMHAP